MIVPSPRLWTFLLGQTAPDPTTSWLVRFRTAEVATNLTRLCYEILEIMAASSSWEKPAWRGNLRVCLKAAGLVGPPRLPVIQEVLVASRAQLRVLRAGEWGPGPFLLGGLEQRENDGMLFRLVNRSFRDENKSLTSIWRTLSRDWDQLKWLEDKF
jgi:hypothetical protein